MIRPDEYPLGELSTTFFLPPVPEVLLQLHDVMEQDEPDLILIANLVARDVGLASAVLSTINSAYYGLQRQVSDIRQAAVLLGSSAMVNLVTTYELRKALSIRTTLTLERFWDCALDVANFSALLVKQLDLRIPVEDVYTTGLFHDCGIPIMAFQHDDYREVLLEANSNYHRSMTAIEQDHYGVHHSLMGYLVTEKWKLPETICQIILQNHERDLWERLDDPHLLRQVAVLKLAENLSDRIRRHCDNPDWPFHRAGVFDALALDDEAFKEVDRLVTDFWFNNRY